MTSQHQKTSDVLNWFEQISQFPRCSGNEAGIRNWLVNWAKQYPFPTKTDSVGNLLIKVPASPGYENAPIVILQAHLDMVCEKTPDSDHDFTKDPIQFIYDGDWLTADRTTLGADNGIGVAMAMALAADKDIAHPPLELLFTVDEESGLVGASALEPTFVEGKILINIDSEDDGCFIIGCAGGLNTHICVPLEGAKIATDSVQALKIKAGGMKGGHSGVNINTQRANAIKILVRTLHIIKQQVAIRLTHFSGGTAHNAIPRNSEALLIVSKNDIETVKTNVLEAEKIFQAEYQKTEPELFLKVEAGGETPNRAITLDDTNNVIDFLTVLPHGVAAMSTDIEGLVETSNNIANVSIENGQLKVLTSQRSSVESRLEALTDQIEAAARLIGAEVDSDTHYPAWQPNMKSPLLAKSRLIYQQLFEKESTIAALHAGLEAGIIGQKIPGMDMISLGPTMQNAHSPDERVHIGTIGKLWDFMVALLKELK